jgi:hypothetical protein
MSSAALPSAVSRATPSTPGHHVQFFETDDFLVGAISDFLAGGLTTGEPMLVIATEPHRSAVAGRLRHHGFDVDGAAAAGQLTMLDARTTLDSIMSGRVPDVARFKTIVGRALAVPARAKVARPVVRVYGEMVDLLWREGNTEGALRLEDLWNEIANDYAFSLLCAYSMGNFYKATDAEHFRAVCHRHSHVAPTERYLRTDEATRLRELAPAGRPRRRAGARPRYSSSVRTRWPRSSSTADSSSSGSASTSVICASS